MSTFTPVQRLTLYAPRSVDPDEATFLTPIAGAAHTDAFKVATRQGIAGYLPYLGEVRGRRGRIDPLTRQTDTGQLTVSLLDKRTGTDNLVRWVTAFWGDAEGRLRELGIKAVVEESLDGGVTWDPEPIFTGRVEEARMRGRLWYEITLRDMADALEAACFVGRPASGVTYAQMAPALPNAPLQAYGTFPTEAQLSGVVDRVRTNSAKGGWVNLDAASRDRARATSIIAKLAGQELPMARVRMSWSDAGVPVTGEFALWRVYGLDQGRREANVGPIRMHTDADGKKFVRALLVRELPSTDPAYRAMPGDTTAVTFHLLPVGPPSKDAPILIDDVHPVQLWRDLLDGKFSILGADGAPMRSIAYDSAAFTALIGDTSIPKGRFRVDEPGKINEWVEKHICQPYNLAYYLDGQGRVVPIDMRPPSSLPTSTTITDDDLVAGPAPEWAHSSSTAITRVEVTHYLDSAIPPEELAEGAAEYPDVPAVLIRSQDLRYIRADLQREKDLPEATHKIDALGFRAASGEQAEGIDRVEWIRRRIDGLIEELRGPYGSGAMEVTLVCRRTANTSGCNQGDWRILDVSALANPASNTRGGNRLARCVERQEDGPQIRLSFVDAGPSSVAVAPTLGTVTLDTSEPVPSVSVGVTLNASGEPAILEFAVTDTAAVARPADASSLWTFGARAAASETVVITPLPSGGRIWLRARTVPQESDRPRLPSPWVYPSTAYVDTPGKPALSNVKVTIAGDGTPTVTWERSSVCLGVRLYYQVHAEGTIAAPTTYVDVDASLLTRTLTGVQVDGGEMISVEAEPWTGWTGTAVSGTAGFRIDAEAYRSNAGGGKGAPTVRFQAKRSPYDSNHKWIAVARVTDDPDGAFVKFQFDIENDGSFVDAVDPNADGEWESADFFIGGRDYSAQRHVKGRLIWNDGTADRTEDADIFVTEPSYPEVTSIWCTPLLTEKVSLTFLLSVRVKTWKALYSKTAMPTDDAVRMAVAMDVGTSIELTTDEIVREGETLYIKAFGYDVDGKESPVFTREWTRPRLEDPNGSILPYAFEDDGWVDVKLEGHNYETRGIRYKVVVGDVANDALMPADDPASATVADGTDPTPTYAHGFTRGPGTAAGMYQAYWNNMFRLNETQAAYIRAYFYPNPECLGTKYITKTLKVPGRPQKPQANITLSVDANGRLVLAAKGVFKGRYVHYKYAAGSNQHTPADYPAVGTEDATLDLGSDTGTASVVLASEVDPGIYQYVRYFVSSDALRTTTNRGASKIAFALGSPTGEQVADANAFSSMVYNPSFEVDANADGVPDGWKDVRAHQNAVIDRVSSVTWAAAGAYALRLVGYLSPEPVAYAAGVQSKQFAVQGNEELRFAVAMKNPNTGSHQDFEVKALWYDSAGALVATDLLSTGFAAIAAGAEAQLSVVVKAPGQAISCAIELRVVNNQALYFDRVYVMSESALLGKTRVDTLYHADGKIKEGVLIGEAGAALGDVNATHYEFKEGQWPLDVSGDLNKGAHLYTFERDADDTRGKMKNLAAAANLHLVKPGKFGGALAVEETTTNLLPATDGQTNTLAGSGAAPPTIVGIDVVHPHGTKAHRVTFPAAAGTDQAIARTAAVSVASGAVHSFAVWIKGDMTSMRVLAIATGYSAALVLTGLERDGWREYALQGYSQNSGGALNFYIDIRTNATRAADTVLEVAAFQAEAKGHHTSFTNGGRTTDHNVNYGTAANPATWPSFSVVAWTWVRDANTATNYRMIAGCYPKFYFSWHPTANDRLYFSWDPQDGTVGQQVVSSNVVTSCHQRWAHVAATYDAPTKRLRLYCDGAIVYDAVLVHPVDNRAPNSFAWGQFYAGQSGYPLGGLMDSAIALPRVLAENEVRAMYNSGGPLMDNAQLWDTAYRTQTGLGLDGKVQKVVPRQYAAGELDAIDLSSGLLDRSYTTKDGMSLAVTDQLDAGTLCFNPNFEADADADGLPDGWTLNHHSTGSAVAASLDTARFITGTKGLKLDPLSTTSGGSIASKPFAVRPGQSYKALVHAYSDTAELDGVYFRLFWYAAATTDFAYGNHLSFTDVVSGVVNSLTQNAWAEIGGVAVAPAGAHYCRVALYAWTERAGAPVWFDFLRINVEDAFEARRRVDTFYYADKVLVPGVLVREGSNNNAVESTVGSQAKATAAEAAALKAAEEKTVKLVNNTTLSGTLDRWTSSSSVAVVENQAFGGATVPVQKVATAGTVGVYSSLFEIDPSKAYEFSFWMKSDGATNNELYFGLNAYTGAGAELAVDQIDPSTLAVASITNPYFWWGDQTGTWKQHIGYVLPANMDLAYFKGLGKNVTYNFRLRSDTKKLRMRWLNWYGDNVNVRTAWVANPMVREINLEALEGHRKVGRLSLIDGVLRDGTNIAEGATTKVIAKGYESGQARHGDAINFQQTFQATPVITVSQGLNNQPNSAKWTPGFDAAKGQYGQNEALNPDPGGFDVRARLMQKASTITARELDFATDYIYEQQAGADDATMQALSLGAAGPAYDDKYTLRFRGKARSVTANVHIDVGRMVGSVVEWTNGVWTKQYVHDSLNPDGTVSDGPLVIEEVVTLVISGLASDSQFRLRITDVVYGTAPFEETSTADRVIIVHPWCTNDSTSHGAAGFAWICNTAGYAGLKWSTASGTNYAERTPETDDRVDYEAIAARS